MMNRGRSTSMAVLLVLVVFAAGFAAGFLVDRYFFPQKDGLNKRPHRGKRRGMLRRMKQRLKLTDDQETKVRAIIGTFRPQMRKLRKSIRPQGNLLREKMRNEIKKLLNAEQKAEFEQMIKDYEKRRQLRRERRRKRWKERNARQ